MSLAVNYCTPDDASELAELSQCAFESAPRFKVMYGKVPRATLVSKSEEGYGKDITSLGQRFAPQQKHCLKVLEPGTGEIMAFAIWAWLPNGYKAEEDSQIQLSDQGLPEGANVALIRDLFEMTGELRSEHPGRSEAHWCMLCVYYSL